MSEENNEPLWGEIPEAPAPAPVERRLPLFLFRDHYNLLDKPEQVIQSKNLGNSSSFFLSFLAFLACSFIDHD
jgi:hypothetical protein